MLKALIIDDEANSRDALKGKLDLFCPEIEVVGEAENIDQALEAAQNLNPDILFLDINLSGEDGFQLLERLREIADRMPEIIFITAHDEYAIKAIKFSAADYLLKPIDPEELVKAVRKIEAKKDVDPASQSSTH